MSEVQAVSEENSDRSSTSEVHDDTQLSTKYFFYTWTLNNFSECMKFSEPVILSPEFEFAGVKWRLWLQSICKNDKLDKVNVRLMQGEKCYSGYYIKHKFSLLNADGSLVFKEAGSLFGETFWGHRLSFKYHEKNKNGSSFIINDKVIVHCELLILASVASNDQISFSSNQSNTSVQRRLNKAMNYPSMGLIQLQSSSQMPKSNKKPKSPARTHIYDISHNKKIDFLLLFALLLLILFVTDAVYNERNSIKEKLNITEVNELIIDSTLKIQSIAEALNLTNVKIKSTELLAWYHDNYNMSNGNYAGSRKKTLSYVIFDHPVLNASSDNQEISINSTDHVNDKENSTGH